MAIPTMFNTAGTIISDAAAELGLGAVADAYGSVDANVVQMRALLKKVGRTLLREHEWPHLVVEATFTTSTDAEQEPLPDDFMALVPGTMWNDSTNRAIHMATPQEWAALDARDVSGTLSHVFRIDPSDFGFNPALPTGTVVIYQYRTCYWVGTTVYLHTADEPTTNAQYVQFDAPLVIAALKYEWKKEKGFDTTGALDDYRVALETAKRLDTAGMPTLNLAGGRGEPLLSVGNTPDTGFGS